MKTYGFQSFPKRYPCGKTAGNCKLKLLSKPLSLSTDGHLITVKDDNSAEIIFFQINGLENNTLEAVGIANLRMTVEQLKALSNAIINTIKTHEDVLIKRSKKIN